MKVAPVAVWTADDDISRDTVRPVQDYQAAGPLSVDVTGSRDFVDALSACHPCRVSSRLL